MKTSKKVPVLPAAKNYEELIGQVTQLSFIQQLESFLQAQHRVLGIKASVFNPDHWLSWMSTPTGIREQIQMELHVTQRHFVSVRVIVPLSITPLHTQYELRAYHFDRKTGRIKEFQVVSKAEVDTDKYRYVISGMAEAETKVAT